MTPSKPSTDPTARTFPIVWVVLIGVVLVAGVTAVILAKRSGDKEVPGQTSKVSIVTGATTTTTATPTTGAGGSTTEPGTIATTQPASTTGTLPLYEATQVDRAQGMTIPTVTGQDFDGNAITIGPDGKAQIILFVAHWCPHCQREVPVIVAHLDDKPMPEDVKLVTVSTSVQVGAENYPPEAWLKREKWSAPVLADDSESTVAQAFGLRAFPYFVVVDAQGKVVFRVTGELSPAQFDSLVVAAQTGKAPT